MNEREELFMCGSLLKAVILLIKFTDLSYDVGGRLSFRTSWNTEKTLLSLWGFRTMDLFIIMRTQCC